MAWIEAHQSLLTHRKTGRMSRRLSISRVTAIGHLVSLWWWCLDNAPEGTLGHIDPQDVADGSQWEGEPSEFVECLVYAGFIDRVGDSLSIHDWDDYAGRLIERRKANTEKVRKWRNERKQVTEPERNHNVTVTQPERNGATVHNTTVHNTTQQNSTQPEDICSGEAAPKKKPDKPLRLQIPPELEWCKEYAKEQNYPHGLAEAFYDHFLGNGWRVGMAKTLMVDWQACMRTFSRHDKQYNGMPTPTRNGSKGETLQEQSELIYEQLYGKAE